MLPDDPPGLPELSHVCDGLGRQSLELFDRVQQLDDALKTPLVNNSSEDFPVETNSDQDFQRSDLIKENKKQVILIHKKLSEMNSVHNLLGIALRRCPAG